MRSEAVVKLAVSLLVFLSLGAALVAQTPAGVPAKQPACTSAEYRQFDFWLGDWDAFEAGSTAPSAHLQVESILGGCVLHEKYEDTGGLQGQSFSIYDASRKVWHQSWVTDRGQLLVVEGKMQSGDMVLSGSQRGADGRQIQIRATWKPVEGGVRETAVKSTDGGKSWKTWFDLMFRKRSATASGSEDEKAVAALDTEYQAAVKNNDAETMNRILADDFVLVTGNGKKHTKSELLEEARAGRTVYEHQEDTEQVVRVWGDTAVVTAKLWEKGTDDSKPFDATLWFSDTYVRTPTGWRYVFGQASLPLPSGH